MSTTTKELFHGSSSGAIYMSIDPIRCSAGSNVYGAGFYLIDDPYIAARFPIPRRSKNIHSFRIREQEQSRIVNFHAPYTSAKGKRYEAFGEYLFSVRDKFKEKSLCRDNDHPNPLSASIKAASRYMRMVEKIPGWRIFTDEYSNGANEYLVLSMGSLQQVRNIAIDPKLGLNENLRGLNKEWAALGRW